MDPALLAQINPSQRSTSVLLLIFMFVLVGFAIIVCIFLAKYFNLWLQAKMTSASITIIELVGMSFRKVNPNIIVRSKIMAYQAGLSEKDGITTRALEAHYLAGGNVPNVVRALIAANRADIPLSYKRAAAIDLAGRNVLEAVQTSVNPKVIPCPDPGSGRNSIDGVAKNGIQLKVKAKVTVRTNLDRLVGGATDETIIARVGEGIVNAIGSADTHNQVLAKPDSISKRVLEKGLDAGTAYEILSIDIADIDVGDNIGANLQALQAEADMRVARAKAEERRAFAVASEQEQVAMVQENRAKVVLADAQVPLAIAEAFRQGNLGITDYYHLRNIQADTEMRSAIAGTGGMGNSRREVSNG
ncbi:MAG: flotillin-like protein FloA [Planctomycetaceae bacterium]|nr:flotillin-like protein FloA [Planctomycetaceae bacterium]